MKKIIRFLALALISVCCVAAAAGCGGKKNIVESYEVVKHGYYCNINIKIKKNVEYTDLYYLSVSNDDYAMNGWNYMLYDHKSLFTDERFIHLVASGNSYAQDYPEKYMLMYNLSSSISEDENYDFRINVPIFVELFIYNSTNIVDPKTDLLNYIGYIKITDFSVYGL